MFNEHGGFKVTLQGNILHLKITGAWNAETAHAYKKIIRSTVTPLEGQSWAAISDVSEWELCTPDCELLIVELAKECLKKGLKREAIVNNKESVKLDLFHKRSKQDNDESPPDMFQRCFFESNKQAMAWLSQQGYSLEQD